MLFSDARRADRFTRRGGCYARVVSSNRRGTRVFATRAGAASEKRMFGENKVPLTTPIFLGRDGRGN
jgi:hypothetical protein